jgi:nicotinate phosphoribosyltransferase
VHAARGRGLIDFALRRTQGIDAGMAVARSTWLAGFDATSNVLAAKIYDIPAAGTMAHSFVQIFEDEKEAFEAYQLPRQCRIICPISGKISLLQAN